MAEDNKAEAKTPEKKPAAKKTPAKKAAPKAGTKAVEEKTAAKKSAPKATAKSAAKKPAAKAAPKGKTLTVRLVRSPIGTFAKQRGTVRGLGLRKVGGERTLEDTPAVRGMVRKIQHMVQVVGQ